MDILIPANMIQDFHGKLHESGNAILELGLDIHKQNERIA